MLVLSAMSNTQVSRAEHALELQVLQATRISDVQKSSGSSFWRAGNNASKAVDSEVLSEGEL